MAIDLCLERALDRVELVTGVGTRDTGRMCVMSLVACLAGEPHGDSPACASPLIRAFAIPLNDNMPHAVRQRLKPFAPRIVGTNDGQDGARAALLRRALNEVIMPHLPRSQAVVSRGITGLIVKLGSWLDRRRLVQEAKRMMSRALALAEGGDTNQAIAAAGAVGRLLALTARGAGDECEANRLWDIAIALLDRLCSAGEETGGAVEQPILVARIGEALLPRLQPATA